MVYKAHIIHSSAIVRNGLSRILEKNYRCKVFVFNSLESLSQNANLLSDDNIYFTQEEIVNSKEYIDLLHKVPTSNLYTICKGLIKEGFIGRHTICIEDSEVNILEQFNNIFEGNIIDKNNEVLSNREIDVLKHVSLGLSNKDIADKLFISIHTVMSHRKNITEKLGIKSISGLTVYAIINNHIDTKTLNINDLI